jgi:hypothetical protein
MCTRSWYKRNALKKKKCRVEMFTNKNVVVSSRPELLRPRKNKCRVVLPSHHREAQNYYDLEKINVEWSCPLTTVTPKIIITTS